MRTRSALISVCLVVLLPAAVNSEEGATSIWRCEAGAFEREITLTQGGPEAQTGLMDQANGLACHVVYTKNGITEMLWQARNDPDFCRPRVLALIEKLRNAGFTCNQVGQTEVGPRTEADDMGAGLSTPGKQEVAAKREATAVPANARSGAVRELLEAYYEDAYLDAMVAAIPTGFSPLPDIGALSAGSGGVLHTGPPNHFVKTLPDGSYVLVNTLLLEQGGASSFVNLGFLVRGERYRFLGYTTAHAVSAVAVQDAGEEQVSLMVSETTPPACVVVRRAQSLRWAPVLEIRYVDVSGAPGDAASCSE